MTFEGPDLDIDRGPPHKRHWDWGPAWAHRFGLVELRIGDRYRVTVEPPAEVSPVRRVYGVLFRTSGKAVLAGPSAAANPELGLIQAEVPAGKEPLPALQDAALRRAGAELGRAWLMFTLLYTPLDEGGEPYYEAIYIAEVENLLETMPDETYTRRTVLVRDLLEAIRRRHYEIAEPLLIAVDRYAQWRAGGEAKQQETEVARG